MQSHQNASTAAIASSSTSSSSTREQYNNRIKSDRFWWLSWLSLSHYQYFTMDCNYDAAAAADGDNDRHNAEDSDDDADAAAADAGDNDDVFVVVDLERERVAYRAEGNANLVLSLCDRGTVLRMRKSMADVATKASPSTMSATATAMGIASTFEGKGLCDADGGKEEATSLRRTVAYMEAISGLFDAEFAATASIVRLRCHNWEAFNRRLLAQRPAHRHDKHVSCALALLYPDAARLPDTMLKHLAYVRLTSSASSLPSLLTTSLCAATTKSLPTSSTADEQVDKVASMTTYAIEIKPKQGWLTATMLTDIDVAGDDDDVVVKTAAMATGKCRFCSLQYLKLQLDKIRERSHYCPLDLFSGCPSRTARAVAALIDRPQNNMRIWANERELLLDRTNNTTHSPEQSLTAHLSVLFGHSNGQQNLDAFVALIVRTLYTEFRQPTHETTTTTIGMPTPLELSAAGGVRFAEPAACDPSAVPLPFGCVLQSVLRVQRLVTPTLQDANNRIGDNGDDDADDVCNDTRIDGIVAKMRNHRQRRRCAYDVPWDNHIGDLSDDERYLLGATALDCSIMITFCRLASADVDKLTAELRSHLIWPQSGDNVDAASAPFAVKVTVIDLDAKHLQRHRRKYVQQWRQSMRAEKCTELRG